MSVVNEFLVTDGVNHDWMCSCHEGSIVRSERNQERETKETQNRLHPLKIRNSQNAQRKVVDNQKLKCCTLKLFCKSLVPKSVPF